MIVEDAGRPVLFFDGVCNLCNNVVQFILKHDRKGIFLFASLQSAPGGEVQKQLQSKYGHIPDSIILFYKGKYYIKSAAVLKTASLMGGIWRLGLAGFAVPGFLRNKIYNWVARHRYNWFGKRDNCTISSEPLEARFLS